VVWTKRAGLLARQLSASGEGASRMRYELVVTPCRAPRAGGQDTARTTGAAVDQLRPTRRENSAKRSAEAPAACSIDNRAPPQPAEREHRAPRMPRQMPNSDTNGRRAIYRIGARLGRGRRPRARTAFDTDAAAM